MRGRVIKIRETIILEGISYEDQIAHEEQLALMGIEMRDLKKRLSSAEISLATIENPCPEGMILDGHGVCVRPNYLANLLE